MGDRDFLEELFSGVGGVVLKRMFGGLGAFRDGLMFAIILEDVIYLKTDDETRPRFEAEGCTAFTYGRSDGRAVSLSYWRIPEWLIDDGEAFTDWAREALGVAVRASAAKPKRAPAKAKRRPKAASLD